jgi:hypothetical protein
MSGEGSFRERRRGERVLIRIPVTVHGLTRDNKHVTQDAETVVVSRVGALLRCHSAFKAGSQLDVTNSFTRQTEKFRVVWISETPKQGFFDIGVEALHSRDEFWGLSFPIHAQR